MDEWIPGEGEVSRDDLEAAEAFMDRYRAAAEAAWPGLSPDEAWQAYQSWCLEQIKLMQRGAGAPPAGTSDVQFWAERRALGLDED